MNYSLLNQDTYYFVDKYGMWCTNFSLDRGKYDSIGRTILAAIAYREEEFVRNVICNCVHGKFDYLQINRHPEIRENNISRDHIVYLLIGLKYFGITGLLDMLSRRLCWRISDSACFTPDMWLWMKGINGSRLALFAFYLLEIPLMGIMSIWNRIIRRIAGFSEEMPQATYNIVRFDLLRNLLPHQKKLRDLLYPSYALHILGWQLYVLPDSWLKKVLQKICLGMTGRYNYLVKLLFNGVVSIRQALNYKHMTSWRWGVNLDETNKRDTYIIDEESWINDNALETDLLYTIFYDLKL